MSSATTPTATNGQAGHKVPPAVENKKLGLARRSTPDSEALLSSDDDHEPNPAMSMSMHSVKSVPAQRPIRRGSWLSEVRTAQRKYSLGGISLASTSGNSQPPTPSAENGHPLEKASSQGQLVSSSLSLWDSTPARPTPVSSTPWGPAASQSSSFWSKKEPPRWGEFSSSPAFSSAPVEDLRSPTNTSAAAENTQSSMSVGIPFDIPLEPNRKTVRSQSYSAGQLDLSSTSESSLFNRFKPKRIHPPSLARRKSRTIMDSGSEFDLASVQEDLEMQTPFNGGVPLPFTSPHVERAHMAARQLSTLSLDNAEIAASSSDSSSEQAGGDPRNRMMSHPSHPTYQTAQPTLPASLVNYHQPGMSRQEFEAQRASGRPMYQDMNSYHQASVHPPWDRPNMSSAEYQQALGRHNALEAQRAQEAQHAFHSYGQTFLPRYYGQPSTANNQPHHGQAFQSHMQAQISRSHQQHGQMHAPTSIDITRPPARASSSVHQHATTPAFNPVSESVPENVVTQAIQNAAIEAQAALLEGEEAAKYTNYDLASIRGNQELGQADPRFGLYSRMNMSPEAASGLGNTGNRMRNTGFPPTSPTQDISRDGRQPLASELDSRFLTFILYPILHGQRRAEKHVVPVEDLPAFLSAHSAKTPASQVKENVPNYKFAVMYHGGYPNIDERVDSYNTGNPHFTDSKDHPNLYLVTFKASRADVFYRPLGFVGDLTEGQMVIVEGDRGLDMGMIAHIELNYDQAKALKAEYNRKHYNTLVRFSRNYPHLAETIVGDPDYVERASQNLADQALGLSATPSGRSTALTPKTIRRVATEREIMLLREKEGNEARAKRICQGKVNQQQLSMEILDAEFQLDYRKLTFYFYSEEYIPFNAIVTDLFKVWKTRIWLSAVNPETYPAPPRRPGDQSRQPRRDGRPHDSRRDQSLQAASAASATRRAYIKGAQDLAMGQFPGMLAAGFMAPNQSMSPHIGNTAQGGFQGGQSPLSSPGQVALPQGPFGNPQPNNHAPNLNTLTFGSMPPMAVQNQFGSPSFGNAPTTNESSFGHGQGQSYYNAQSAMTWATATSPSLRTAPAVAEALASRGELPPAFVPSGQQYRSAGASSSSSVLPGLGDLSLGDKAKQRRL